MGLNEFEDKQERAAILASIPEDAVMVTGQQRSGTRLMCRILEAGGFAAWHDSRHGLRPRPVGRVVVMVRDQADSLRSAVDAFDPRDVIDPDLSYRLCVARYPRAHFVSYERLCTKPDRVVLELAGWLGCGPWPLPEPIAPVGDTIGRQAWP